MSATFELDRAADSDFDTDFDEAPPLDGPPVDEHDDYDQAPPASEGPGVAAPVNTGNGRGLEESVPERKPIPGVDLPVLVSDWWDDPTVSVLPKPSLCVYDSETGAHLLYRGKVNGLIGPGGQGKSILMTKLHLLASQEGEYSLFLDAEKSLADFLGRLKAQGATREEASRIIYWNPTGGLWNVSVLSRVMHYVEKYELGLVSVDTLNQMMTMAGMDENSNDDARRFIRERLYPVSDTGTSVLYADHIGHIEKGRKTNLDDVMRARGASAKRDATTGTMFGILQVETFSKTKAGHSQLVIAKDNNGGFTYGEVIAEMHVAPKEMDKESDEFTCELRTYTDPDANVPRDSKGRKLMTTLCERVSDYLEDEAERDRKAGKTEKVGWRSATNVRDNVKGDRNFIGPTLEQLHELGCVEPSKVEGDNRKTKYWVHVRAFGEVSGDGPDGAF